MVFDIRDWEKIDLKDAKRQLENLFEYGSFIAFDELQDFIQSVELLKEKQLQEHNKSIPAILRK